MTTIRHEVWLLLSAAFCALAIIVIVSNMPPQIKPSAPSDDLFSISTATGGIILPSESDFVARPLFSASRRPPTAEEVVTSTTLSDTAPRLEGVSLIGVFASGDTKGVIVRRESGEQLRVVTGAELDGWRLDGVEARAAIFVSGSEAGLTTDRLEMGLISRLPAPETVGGFDSEDSGLADPTEQPAPALTFEAIHRRQAAEAQKSRDNDGNPPK